MMFSEGDKSERGLKIYAQINFVFLSMIREKFVFKNAPATNSVFFISYK